MEKVHPLVIPALVLAAIFGGLSPIFLKIALKELNPSLILFIRFSNTFLLLLPIYIFRKTKFFSISDLPKIALAGALFSSNVFCFAFGLQYTTAIVSQIFYLLEPIIVLLFSAIFLKSTIRLVQIAGTLIAIIGGIWLIKGNLNQIQITQSLGTLKGNLIILAGVFCWSFYMILSKKLNQKYSPLALLTAVSLITTVFSLIISLLRPASFIKLTNLMPETIFSLLALVILNSLIMFFLLQWSIHHSSPFMVACSSYLGPLVAALLAIPLFGEKLSPALLISTGLIFFGFYLAVIQPLLAKRKSCTSEL